MKTTNTPKLTFDFIFTLVLGKSEHREKLSFKFIWIIFLPVLCL